MSKIINITAILLTIIAIVVHSEILTLIILTAGTIWACGFIFSCFVRKEEQERYGR